MSDFDKLMEEAKKSGNGHVPAGTVTEADLPKLGKKEEDRKGAALLPGTAVPSAPLLARAAAAGTGGLKALLTGKLGMASLAAVVASTGVGLIGFAALKRAPGAGGGPQVLASSVAPISSTIKVSRGGSKSWSLDYARHSGQKDGIFAEEEAAKASGSPAPAADAPAPAAPAAQGEAMVAHASPEEPQAPQGQLSESFSKAKLSSELGKGGFGRHDIFARAGAGNKANIQFGKVEFGKTGKGAAAPGRNKLTAMRRSTALTADRVSRRGVTSGRAVGQLKYANSRSQAGASTNEAESGSTYGSQAFEQNQGTGGTVAPETASGMTGGETVVPLGGTGASSGGTGAGTCPSGWTSMTGGGCQPPTTSGQNVTPYQGLVDSADQMRQTVIMLMVLAIVLIAAGVYLIATTVGFGAIIGGLLIAIGVGMIAMAVMLSHMGAGMGQNIGSSYGQQDQGEIIERDLINAQNQTDATNVNRDPQRDTTASEDAQTEAQDSYNDPSRGSSGSDAP